MYTIEMKQLIKACFLLFISLGIAGAEEQLLKMYNNQNIGEATLTKQTMFADARGIGTTYYISVPKDAAYYVSTVTNGVEGKEYNVTVDGNSFVEGKIKLGNGWLAGLMVDRTVMGAAKTIHLTEGDHAISFSGKGPEVPFIERIRIAENESDALLSAADLISWAATLSAKTIPADYLEKKKVAGTGLYGTVGVTSAPDPLYQYTGVTNLSITATTCVEASLTAGTRAVFRTSGSTVDPVLYVFSKNSPAQYSWSNDDYSGYESRVSFTVPSTETYLVVLRSYTSGQTGTTTILYNGSTWMSGAAIGGTMVYCGTSVSGTANYFTCNPGQGVYTTDTRLFTLSGWTSPANGQNDDYWNQGGDFYWGFWSRIKLTDINVNYCLVSRFSGAGATTCDFYGNCPFSTIMPYFPNLKADDAIKSSDASGSYQCIAWSGAITTENIWPPSDVRWNQGVDALGAFDNYYNNYPTPRYSNAIDYPTRVDPSTPGVEIDLWALGSYPDYVYKHGSVMKPGNDEMHGYDWESKPGSLTRTFHPRNALGGSSYGQVVYSYKRAGTMAAASSQGPIVRMNGVTLTQKAVALGITRPLSLDSSIALGLTVMRNMVFSDAEKNKIAALIGKIPDAIKNEFYARISAWEKTWSDPKLAMESDPREFAKSKEYVALRDFFDNKGMVIWPLLFAKAQENIPYITLLLEDVLLSSAKSEMSAVNVELGGNQFTTDGAFVYTSNKDRWVTLCKKLLMNRF